MTLEIQLDEKNEFTAGDLVKGNVVLESNKDQAVGRVRIIFYGRAKTMINRHQQNTPPMVTRCMLFEITKDLFIGSYTLRRGRYEWPFQFEFPMYSQPGMEERFINGGVYAGADVAVPLPPTFSANHTGLEQTSITDVEYKLKATVTRPPDAPFLRQLTNMESKLSVKYFPGRLEESPNLCLQALPSSFNAKSLHLLPHRSHDKLTIKEKLRSTFKSSELPNVDFIVELRYPTQIYPGGPFPITLALTKMQKSDDVEDDPPVMIKSVSVNVVAQAQCRTKGMILPEHTGYITLRADVVKTPGKSLNIELPPLNSKAVQAGTESGEVDITKLGKLSCLSKRISNDFRVHNILLQHELRVKVKLTCAQKQFEIRMEKPLRVLPALYRGPTRMRPMSAEQSSWQVEPNSGEETALESSELPAYEGRPPQYELACQ